MVYLVKLSNLIHPLRLALVPQQVGCATSNPQHISCDQHTDYIPISHSFSTLFCLWRLKGFGSGGGFGAAQPAAQTGGGLFGQQQNQTQTPSFGGFGASTNNATTGGAFGARPAASTGFGGFGASSTNTGTSSFTFGSNANQQQQQQPAASGFGASTFGSAAPATGGLFGQQQQQPAAGGFGATAGAFGQQAPGATPGQITQGTATVPYDPLREDLSPTEHMKDRKNWDVQQSITVMPAYCQYSVEELRLMDYQQGRQKGNTGPGATGAPSTGFGFGASNTTGGAFGQPQQPSTGFGATPSSTTGGLFGQPQQQQQTVVSSVKTISNSLVVSLVPSLPLQALALLQPAAVSLVNSRTSPRLAVSSVNNSNNSSQAPASPSDPNHSSLLPAPASHLVPTTMPLSNRTSPPLALVLPPLNLLRPALPASGSVLTTTSSNSLDRPALALALAQRAQQVVSPSARNLLPAVSLVALPASLDRQQAPLAHSAASVLPTTPLHRTSLLSGLVQVEDSALLQELARAQQLPPLLLEVSLEVLAPLSLAVVFSVTRVRLQVALLAQQAASASVPTTTSKPDNSPDRQAPLVALAVDSSAQSLLVRQARNLLLADSLAVQALKLVSKLARVSVVLRLEVCSVVQPASLLQEASHLVQVVARRSSAATTSRTTSSRALVVLVPGLVRHRTTRPVAASSDNPIKPRRQALLADFSAVPATPLVPRSLATQVHPTLAEDSSVARPRTPPAEVSLVVLAVDRTSKLPVASLASWRCAEPAATEQPEHAAAAHRPGIARL